MSNDLINKAAIMSHIESEYRQWGEEYGVEQILGDIEDFPVADSGGRWITCESKMPEEHDSMFAKLKGTDKWSSAMFEKISNEVNVTIEFEDGKRAVKTLHTLDGRWNEGNRGIKFKVIAWQPLPKPYHPQLQRS